MWPSWIYHSQLGSSTLDYAHEDATSFHEQLSLAVDELSLLVTREAHADSRPALCSVGGLHAENVVLPNETLQEVLSTALHFHIERSISSVWLHPLLSSKKTKRAAAHLVLDSTWASVVRGNGRDFLHSCSSSRVQQSRSHFQGIVVLEDAGNCTQEEEKLLIFEDPRGRRMLELPDMFQFGTELRTCLRKGDVWITSVGVPVTILPHSKIKSPRLLMFAFNRHFREERELVDFLSGQGGGGGDDEDLDQFLGTLSSDSSGRTGKWHLWGGVQGGVETSRGKYEVRTARSMLVRDVLVRWPTPIYKMKDAKFMEEVGRRMMERKGDGSVFESEPGRNQLDLIAQCGDEESRCFPLVQALQEKIVQHAQNMLTAMEHHPFITTYSKQPPRRATCRIIVTDMWVEHHEQGDTSMLRRRRRGSAGMEKHLQGIIYLSTGANETCPSSLPEEVRRARQLQEGDGVQLEDPRPLSHVRRVPCEEGVELMSMAGRRSCAGSCPRRGSFPPLALVRQRFSSLPTSRQPPRPHPIQPARQERVTAVLISSLAARKFMCLRRYVVNVKSVKVAACRPPFQKSRDRGPQSD
mmetsp:Transcript_45083/g.141919  ORF Transcript_45083/g.141919 Transcript_45083/m.141919 type:complete len:581 (+) Transcript_45083:252-1994(+)